MNRDEIKADTELWKRKYIKKSSMFNRYAKKAQVKMNAMIPDKAHSIVTESIKRMVEMTLKGNEWIKTDQVECSDNILEREKQMSEKLRMYRKAAMVEGAGTGAGGFVLGLADFPLLLSIKMKFLSECASIHGYDEKSYEERLFMLYVFQLAFSSDEHRKDVLFIIENWSVQKERLVEMDWRVFQQEYRDFIDLIKLLQLVPGVGAVVGAFANFKLLDQLGEVAKYAYRIRYFNEC